MPAGTDSVATSCPKVQRQNSHGLGTVKVATLVVAKNITPS